MLLNVFFGGLGLLSLALGLWQWAVARRFPLHRREPPVGPAPGVTLLKPLKGCDQETRQCLRSWLTQVYSGPIQVLFGVASADDPVCQIVRELLKEFPGLDAELVICGPLAGTNLKVSKLMQLEKLVRHEIVVISDADVRVAPDFLENAVSLLRDETVGLVNSFYQLANPETPALQWEAVAINADFWSQVLQSQSLKPMDFALGAVMATRRRQLSEIGGFAGLADCLADDYQLGKRIASRGFRIVIGPIVAECWSGPMGWAAVWKHQLRWARTIRVCQPVPYFFSILSNATLWPLLWLVFCPINAVLAVVLGCWLIRITTALHLIRLLTRKAVPWHYAGLVVLKDLMQVAIWFLAFTGNRVEWRGELRRLRRDGTLEPI